MTRFAFGAKWGWRGASGSSPARGASAASSSDTTPGSSSDPANIEPMICRRDNRGPNRFIRAPASELQPLVYENELAAAEQDPEITRPPRFLRVPHARRSEWRPDASEKRRGLAGFLFRWRPAE